MNKILTYLLSFALLSSIACNFTQKIRDGKTAYDRKQFSVAIPMLKKEYSKEKSRVAKGKIAYWLAESYRRTNQIEESIDWYKNAYDNNYGPDALKYHAYGLKRTEQYDEAKKAFKNLGIEIGSPYEYRREITACEVATTWKKDAEKTGYEVLPNPFNSSAADYAPSLFGENQLVITSDRKTSTGEEFYNWTGKNFSDLFVVDLATNQVEAFDSGINTASNEGTVCFNPTYTELYFTRCFDEDERADNYCKLMVSRKEGESWSNPELLNFVQPKINYGHPSISKDGKTLYFSADNPEGWGGFDIYQSQKSIEGWGDPKLLSRAVNSPGDEKFPFIDADTLYFSSDYHTGMGGLDIFRSYKMKNEKWSPIHNLRAPINSGADDFGYVVDYRMPKEKDILQQGYFSSSRSSGKGADDIFKFKKGIPPPPPPPPVVDSTAIPEPIVYKMILEGYVLEKIYKIPNNPNSQVLGRKPLADAKVDILLGQQTKKITVGEDGFFSIEMEEEADYSFFASKANYLNNTASFSTKGIGKDPNNPVTKYEIEIELDKIFKNTEITLDNIYYDFNKANIRNDATPTLNKLATILVQNPVIKIQLSSHTDCRGNAKYNEDLSQRRAQSAVDYLISKGIASDRVIAKGYGKALLAVDCICTRCSEDEHQINRRTTFKVID